MARNKKIEKENEEEKKGGKENIVFAIALIVVGGLVGFVTYIALNYAYRSEDDLSVYTGRIIKEGEYEEVSQPRRDPNTGMKERTVQKFYYIRLEGIRERLITYNLDQEYYKIDREVNVGDMVTVSYIPLNSSESSISSIKKGDQVVFHDDHITEKIFGFIALIGTILIFWKVYSLLKK